jgi:hypothetical protein
VQTVSSAMTEQENISRARTRCLGLARSTNETSFIRGLCTLAVPRERCDSYAQKGLQVHAWSAA